MKIGSKFFLSCILLTFLCWLILCFPGVALQSAGQAMSLWATSVVPALFPFAVVMSTLISLHALDGLSRLLHPLCRKLFGLNGHFAYLFTASALSGYPMGAKLTVDLYRQGQLKRSQAETLLGCVSTSGPAFIISSVCIGMLGDRTLAPYLLWPHYLSALLICLLAGRSAGDTAPTLHYPVGERCTLGAALSASVQSCMQSMLTVCGFMVLYAVITATLGTALHKLFGMEPSTTQAALGLLELTIGCANTDFLPLPLRLPLLSLFLAFGGLSVHSQTRALAASAGLAPRHFLIHKSIQGILSMVLTALMMRIRPLDAFAADPQLQLPLPLLWSLFCCLLLAMYATQRWLTKYGDQTSS